MNILAISGSLRVASINSALLRATARLAPPGLAVRIFAGLGDIPLFNPDIESPHPGPVAAFYRDVVAADALIIASPEYAHGVTGVLKNALDWLVGTDAFVLKPVAVFNASPYSLHADPALREVLSVMSARIVEPASIALPVRGSRLDDAGIAAHPGMSVAITSALQALAAAVREFRAADTT